MGTRMTTLSIILPIQPGPTPRALERLDALDWPPDQLELLVARGMSPSAQRNAAAHAATGEILYFIDDDSLIPPDQLQRIVKSFADPSMVAIGGPSLTPEDDSFLQRCIGEVLGSLIGAGSVRARYCVVGEKRPSSERELILCNLAIRRSAFLAAGGLNEALYPNEENELLDRLKQQGGVVWYDPAMAVYRSQRETMRAFVYQMFRYGRGRGQQTRISGTIPVTALAPLLLWGYLVGMALTPSIWLAIPLICYLLLGILTGFRAAYRCRMPGMALLFPVLVGVMHLSNGFGLARGLLSPAPRPDPVKSTQITIEQHQVDCQQSPVSPLDIP